MIHPTIRHPLWGAVVTAVCACVCAPASADVFHLYSGGQIEGEVVAAADSPKDQISVRLADGVMMVLAKEAVERHEKKSEARRRYEILLPKMTDTAEDNWKMAQQVCLPLGLTEERAKHLRRVIELEPEHEGARRGLGYSRLDDGRWVIWDEFERSRGKVRYKGSWRTRQEVAVLQSAERHKQAEGQWVRDLKMWRRWLATENRRGQAINNFRGIKDWVAAQPLAEMLDEEQDPGVKRLYMEVLGRLANNSATTGLVKRALEDPDETIRLEAIDYLKEIGSPGVLQTLRRALGTKEIYRINNAAVALSRLGDTEAVPQLIEALTSVETIRVGGSSGGQGLGSIGASFGSNGGGGLSAGSKPKIIQREVANQNVLAALQNLTGANLSVYNRELWRKWYTENNTPKDVNLRRRDD